MAKKEASRAKSGHRSRTMEADSGTTASDPNRVYKAQRPAKQTHFSARRRVITSALPLMDVDGKDFPDVDDDDMDDGQTTLPWGAMSPTVTKAKKVGTKKAKEQTKKNDHELVTCPLKQQTLFSFVRPNTTAEAADVRGPPDVRESTITDNRGSWRKYEVDSPLFSSPERPTLHSTNRNHLSCNTPKSAAATKGIRAAQFVVQDSQDDPFDSGASGTLAGYGDLSAGASISFTHHDPFLVSNPLRADSRGRGNSGDVHPFQENQLPVDDADPRHGDGHDGGSRKRLHLSQSSSGESERVASRKKLRKHAADTVIPDSGSTSDLSMLRDSKENLSSLKHSEAQPCLSEHASPSADGSSSSSHFLPRSPSKTQSQSSSSKGQFLSESSSELQPLPLSPSQTRWNQRARSFFLPPNSLLTQPISGESVDKKSFHESGWPYGQRPPGASLEEALRRDAEMMSTSSHPAPSMQETTEVDHPPLTQTTTNSTVGLGASNTLSLTSQNERPSQQLHQEEKEGAARDRATQHKADHERGNVLEAGSQMYLSPIEISSFSIPRSSYDPNAEIPDSDEDYDLDMTDSAREDEVDGHALLRSGESLLSPGQNQQRVITVSSPAIHAPSQCPEHERQVLSIADSDGNDSQAHDNSREGLDQDGPKVVRVHSHVLPILSSSPASIAHLSLSPALHTVQQSTVLSSSPPLPLSQFSVSSHEPPVSNHPRDDGKKREDDLIRVDNLTLHPDDFHLGTETQMVLGKNTSDETHAPMPDVGIPSSQDPVINASGSSSSKHTKPKRKKQAMFAVSSPEIMPPKQYPYTASPSTQVVPETQDPNLPKAIHPPSPSSSPLSPVSFRPQRKKHHGGGHYSQAHSSPQPGNLTQYTQGMESQRVPLHVIRKMPTPTPRSDIFLSLHPVHVGNIVSGAKTHEFRRYRIPIEVARIWIYVTKPASQLQYMACIEQPAKEPGEIDADDDGVGNAEFNRGEKLSKFAYALKELYELNNPVSLAKLKENQWMAAPPQKYTFVPPVVVSQLLANLQRKIHGKEEEEEDEEVEEEDENGDTQLVPNIFPRPNVKHYHHVLRSSSSSPISSPHRSLRTERGGNARGPSVAMVASNTLVSSSSDLSSPSPVPSDEILSDFERDTTSTDTRVTTPVAVEIGSSLVVSGQDIPLSQATTVSQVSASPPPSSPSSSVSSSSSPPSQDEPALASSLHRRPHPLQNRFREEDVVDVSDDSHDDGDEEAVAVFHPLPSPTPNHVEPVLDRRQMYRQGGRGPRDGSGSSGGLSSPTPTRPAMHNSSSLSSPSLALPFLYAAGASSPGPIPVPNSTAAAVADTMGSSQLLSRSQRLPASLMEDWEPPELWDSDE